MSKRQLNTDENAEKMYAVIDSERARNNLTVAQMCEAIGIDAEKTYRNWRSELKPLPSGVIVQMARLFGCSVDWLLGLSDTRNYSKPEPVPDEPENEN